jgi:hypothetical protein
MCSEGSQQETCITLSHWPQSQVGAQPTHSFSPTGLPLAPKSDALEMPRSKPPLRCGNQPVPGSGNRLSHREPTPLTHSSSSQPGPSTCPAAPVSPWRLSVCGWGAPSRPLSLSHPPGASLSPPGARTQLPVPHGNSRRHSCRRCSRTAALTVPGALSLTRSLMLEELAAMLRPRLPLLGNHLTHARSLLLGNRQGRARARAELQEQKAAQFLLMGQLSWEEKSPAWNVIRDPGSALPHPHGYPLPTSSIKMG